MHSPHWAANRHDSLSDWFISSNHLAETGRADFLSQLFFDFLNKIYYNTYRKNEKGKFSNDVRSAESTDKLGH